MDSQEFRSLQEAYMEVVENQQLDEVIRNPESRKKLRDIEDREVRKGDKSKGENPRSKYSTEKGKQASRLLRGPEETGSKKAPVRSRGGGTVPSDERVVKSARPENTKYWASVSGPSRDRGAGSKAKRRAAALNKEEVDIYDIILSHLLDEGYAETPAAAEAIMVNMSEEWRDSIIG